MVLPAARAVIGHAVIDCAVIGCADRTKPAEAAITVVLHAETTANSETANSETANRYHPTGNIQQVTGNSQQVTANR